jgi:hypothetical protein
MVDMAEISKLWHLSYPSYKLRSAESNSNYFLRKMEEVENNSIILHASI